MMFRSPYIQNLAPFAYYLCIVCIQYIFMHFSITVYFIKTDFLWLDCLFAIFIVLWIRNASGEQNFIINVWVTAFFSNRQGRWTFFFSFSSRFMTESHKIHLNSLQLKAAAALTVCTFSGSNKFRKHDDLGLPIITFCLQNKTFK